MWFFTVSAFFFPHSTSYIDSVIHLSIAALDISTNSMSTPPISSASGRLFNSSLPPKIGALKHFPKSILRLTKTNHIWNPVSCGQLWAFTKPQVALASINGAAIRPQKPYSLIHRRNNCREFLLSPVRPPSGEPQTTASYQCSSQHPNSSVVAFICHLPIF